MDAVPQQPDDHFGIEAALPRSIPVDSYAIIGAGGFGREVMPLASEELGDVSCMTFGGLVFVVGNPAAPLTRRG
jgi:hypothetical protein